MPRIPIYQQQQTPSTPLGDNRASLQAPHALSQNGVGAIARGLSDIAGLAQSNALGNLTREKEQADTEARIWAANATSKIDLDMAQRIQELKENAQPGAPSFTPNYLKEFDAYSDSAIQNAPNELARNLLRAHVAASRDAYGKSALSYESGERARHLGTQIDDGIGNSAKIVSANPAWFDREAGKWGSAINALNLPQEAKEALRKNAEKQLVDAAVVAWIDKNPTQASKVINDIMTGDDPSPSIQWTENGQTYSVPFSMGSVEERRVWAKYAESKQKEVSVKQFAGTIIEAANTAVSSTDLMPGDLVDLPTAKAQALDIARSTMGDLTPEQALRIEAQVERAAADRERDIKRRREAVMADAFTRLDQNGGDYQALLRDAPHIATQLNQDQLQRVNRYAWDVSVGGTRPTDWVAYGQLIDQPELLKSVNLGAIKDKFNAKEYSGLVKAQESLLNDPQAEQNLLSTTAVVNSLLKQAKVADDEKHKKFFSLLQQGIDQELAASGKKSLPQKQIEEMAKDLLVKEITERGVLWDSQDKAFDIEVPQLERLKIEAALISEGLPVNELNVLNAYRSKLRRKFGSSNQERQTDDFGGRVVTPSDFPDVPPLLSSDQGQTQPESPDIGEQRPAPAVIPSF